MRQWIGFVAATACVLGAAGVALGAAAAHGGGGGLAATASSFLLFHAAALIGLCVAASRASRGRLLMLAASLLAAGTLLFSGHLALHAFAGRVPVPAAAPIGGSLTILGWLLAAVGLPTALAPAQKTD